MRRKYKLLNDNRGMSTVEVVAALAIVSLVLVSLWEGYNLAELSRRQSELHQAVAQTAETLLAQIERGAADGEEMVETSAGRLRCTWQLTPAPTDGLQEVLLVITEEATGKAWRFATVR